MSAADLVSVVIPTRNRCGRLMQAIASVRRQTGVDLEIIVVDDASADGTAESLAALAVEEPRLSCVRNETPLGGGGARNAGAAAARGRYLAFLDDDDQFLPGKLERQLAALRGEPTAPAVSCGFEVYDCDRQRAVRIIRAPRDRQEILRANVLGGASVCMVRSDAFRAVGGFDPRLRAGQDWDLWLKLHALGPLLVCDEPLVRYNLHLGGQITGNLRSEYGGRRRIHLRYGKEMSPAVRRHSLAELAFYRRVLPGTSSGCRARGLARFALLAGGLGCLRFAWRALRLLRQRALARRMT